MGKITSKKSKAAILSVDQQEAALQQVYQSETKKATKRFTIDLPLFIYDQIEVETEMTGQTKKGFVLGLISRSFHQKGIIQKGRGLNGLQCTMGKRKYIHAGTT